MKATAPIFKGATRPPLTMGVPINALSLVLVLTAVMIITGFIFQYGLRSLIFIIIPIVIIPVLQSITKQDDHLINIYMNYFKSEIANKLRAIGEGRATYYTQGKLKTIPPKHLNKGN